MATQVPAEQVAHAEALTFYSTVLPIVEQLDALAEAWHDAAAARFDLVLQGDAHAHREADQELAAAIEIHNETMAFAIRVELAIDRCQRREVR